MFVVYSSFNFIQVIHCSHKTFPTSVIFMMSMSIHDLITEMGVQQFCVALKQSDKYLMNMMKIYSEW